MYDEPEMRSDPDKWMSPDAVVALWARVGFWELSRGTVHKMMEEGWFHDRGIETEEFDPGHFRVLRDDLLRYLVWKVARITALLSEECEARGIDAAAVIAERMAEGETGKAPTS